MTALLLLIVGGLLVVVGVWIERTDWGGR